MLRASVSRSTDSATWACISRVCRGDPEVLGRELAALDLVEVRSTEPCRWPRAPCRASSRQAGRSSCRSGAAGGGRRLVLGEGHVVLAEVRHHLGHDLSNQLFGIHDFSYRYSTRSCWVFLFASHNSRFLDVQQRGDGLILRPGHLVVADRDGVRRFTLGVLGRVLADRPERLQVDQRGLAEQLQVAQRRQVLLVDHRRAAGLDADADAGAGQLRRLVGDEADVGGAEHPDEAVAQTLLLDAGADLLEYLVVGETDDGLVSGGRRRPAPAR